MDAAVSLEAELAFIRDNDITDVPEWYIIDVDWLKRWKAYAMREGLHPGAISNYRLLDVCAGYRSPLPGLQPVRHYRGVGEEVWNFFVERYGGGPAITSPTLNIYAAGHHVHLPQEDLPLRHAVHSRRILQEAVGHRRPEERDADREIDTVGRSRSGGPRGRRRSSSRRQSGVQRTSAFLAVLFNGGRILPLPQLRRKSTSSSMCAQSSTKSDCSLITATSEPREVAEETSFAQPPPEENSERALCVVCLDKRRSTRILPCSHCILCTDCADELFKAAPDGRPVCPTCRQPADRFEEAEFVQTFAPKRQRQRGTRPCRC